MMARQFQKRITIYPELKAALNRCRNGGFFMKLYEICFSPTGGTKKVSRLLSETLSDNVISVDLTDPALKFSDVCLERDDAAIIAVPSYGGRVPQTAIQRLSDIHGGNARAILVCVYGNRDYEDTLAELEDTAAAAGFQTIAAVAAIAEHSIARQFAAGRPDAADTKQLKSFAGRIRSKLEQGGRTTPAIPGNRPTKKAAAPVWCRCPAMTVSAADCAHASAQPALLILLIPESRCRPLHLLYALHRTLSSCCPASGARDAGSRPGNAAKGMHPAQRL